MSEISLLSSKDFLNFGAKPKYKSSELNQIYYINAKNELSTIIVFVQLNRVTKEVDGMAFQ